MAKEKQAGPRITIIGTGLIGGALGLGLETGQIAEYLQESTVVTDTASTKAEVLRWAEQLLPSHVSFVGGHPMAGKETPGIDEAEATLFQGKAYCICPGEGATDQAVRSVIGLAQAVGAEPLFMDAQEHDQYTTD